MKFSKNKDGLTVLRTNMGEPLAFTGTIDRLMEVGALIEAPKDVNGAKWFIITVTGEEKQNGFIYENEEKAKAAMLTMFE